jgi:hypothetical protein
MFGRAVRSRQHQNFTIVSCDACIFLTNSVAGAVINSGRVVTLRVHVNGVQSGQRANKTQNSKWVAHRL